MAMGDCVFHQAASSVHEYASSVRHGAARPGWCLLFAFGLYFGVCFYLNYWMKLLATFAFVYYLMKVSVYECILVYKELVEEKL